MSAAFDTIDRTELLDTLKDIVNDDELRIIQFLLSKTTIHVKVNGTDKKLPFTTNIGTPQGDSLSPVLFIVYLENALRETRKTEENTKPTPPKEVIYADDIDFIGDSHLDLTEIENILQKHNLKVNVDKTEHTRVRRDTEDWKKTKKVGSLIDSKKDIEHRKHLSNIALTKLSSIWKRANKVRQKTRIKIYNSLVRSILLYNCGTLALTKTDEDKLDSFHRRQLRRVLGIHYPTKISNTSLYKKCAETPLSMQILQSRWRLFGHILRRDASIPANASMSYYFSETKKRGRGRPTTTLPVTLNNDLKKLHGKSLKLTTAADLDKICTTAEDRQGWKTFTAELMKTAEAARSDDHAGERL